MEAEFSKKGLTSKDAIKEMKTYITWLPSAPSALNTCRLSLKIQKQGTKPNILQKQVEERNPTFYKNK
ncbi:hypothetical protein F7734_26700 [Scytonema sp. UIC 10036]|nr:hypothetical protein [Scytonema sp. UIC 10036]